jgi:hypothetical protein
MNSVMARYPVLLLVVVLFGRGQNTLSMDWKKKTYGENIVKVKYACKLLDI